MMKLESIVVNGDLATLCFINPFLQKKIYKDVTIIEHAGEMIFFRKDDRSYLFDGMDIQEAEEIMLHDKFTRCYTLKEKEHFTLFCEGKQSFKISGADIKGIVPISEGRFIVEYDHEIHVYKDDAHYVRFTKVQAGEDKEDG